MRLREIERVMKDNEVYAKMLEEYDRTGKLPMKIKAVIFDLDGVIADTEHLSERADEIVLGKYGIKMTEKEKHEAFGRRVEEIFEDALKARKIRLGTRKLVSEKDKVFLNLIRGKLRPIRNSLELVKFLRKNGYKVALATSSHMVKMDAELKELGIEKLFRIKINGDHVKKGKPDPEIFLKAAEKLKVNPGECAVIEDSAFGVQAAKRAGMMAIGFRSPNSPNQDLSGADMVVDDLGKVRACFK